MRKKRSATMFGRSDDPGRSHEALQAEKESVARFGTARSVLARMNPGLEAGPDGEAEGPAIRLLGPSAPEGYRRRRARSGRATPSGAGASGRSRPASGRSRPASASRPGRGAGEARGRTGTPTRRAPTRAPSPPPDLVVTISRPTSRGRLQLDEEALVRAGALLREAREACGLDVDEVSQACGLSPQQIEHFEAGRPPALAPVYVIGQLRTLARLYGLDEQAIVPPPRPAEAPTRSSNPRSRRSGTHGGRAPRADAHVPLVRRVPVDDVVTACQWLGCRVLQSVHAHQDHTGVADPVVLPATDPPA